MSATPFIFRAVLGVLLASTARSEEKAPEQPVKTLTSMDVLDNVTRLESGWFIGVRIIEDKREELLQTIAATGEVQIPYLGLMKAEGLTCRELAFQIKASLEKTFFKVATVLITSKFKPREHEICVYYDPNYVPFVFVSGKVSKAGKLTFPDHEDLTVSGLLSIAGGPTSKSSTPKILIIRKTPQGNKTILVNTKAALVQKRSEYDLFLRPDDVVIVE